MNNPEPSPAPMRPLPVFERCLLCDRNVCVSYPDSLDYVDDRCTDSGSETLRCAIEANLD